jgi:hypothetical protein
VPLTNTPQMEIEPDWSPSTGQIVYHVGVNVNDEIYKMNADGSGVTALTTTGPVVKERPVWSPDGDKIAFSRGAFASSEIWVMNPDGSSKTQITNNTFLDMQPTWQPIPVNTYPRPLSSKRRARWYLVPAYNQCTSPNRQHGPPQVGGSCSPPTLTSPYLVTKTNFEGYLGLKLIIGNPSNGFDDSKIKFSSKVLDVYRKDNGTDYNREIRFEVKINLTDRYNTPHPGGFGAGTVEPITLGWTVPCNRTFNDPVRGGECTINFKDDVLAPNLVNEGKRSIWEFEQIRVYDGGADYDADTLADNRLFAVQGYFVP